MAGYLAHKDTHDIHIVSYERFLYAFETELGCLLDYLGLDLSRKTIHEVKHNMSFHSMKNKNPHHVRKGQSGCWQKTLPNRQKRWAKDICGPMLKLLHYPIEESVSETSLPYPRKHCDAESISRAQLYAHMYGKLNGVCKTLKKLW